MLLDIRYYIGLVNFYKCLEPNLELWLIQIMTLIIWQLVCIIFKCFMYEMYSLILGNYVKHNMNLWLIITEEFPGCPNVCEEILDTFIHFMQMFIQMEPNLELWLIKVRTLIIWQPVCII